MYHPDVIAARKGHLEQSLKEALPQGLEEIPPETCHAWTRQLQRLWDPDKREQTRPFSREEEAFVANERLLIKISYPYWAQRYCNPPEAPIWMGDLTFKPLGAVKVGDVVIGWQKTGRSGKKQFNRDRLVRTRVLAIQRRFAPLVRVVMASGRTLRCTSDHLWSNHVQPCGRWTVAKPGVTLSHVADPVDVLAEDCYAAGWLGGMYDGEGSHRFISQYQKANPATHRMLEARLLRFQIPHTKTAVGYTITGGRQGLLRFLLIAKPEKRAYFEQVVLGCAFRTPDRVVSVTPDGFGEVISLQTETGNYVAWGYASKNCMIQSEGQRLKPMYPLWESQRLILEELSELEYARWHSGHPDGILFNLLKGRQLGASTFCQSCLAHRTTTHGYVKALIASDVPENSGSQGIFGMYELAVANLPWWLKPSEIYHTKDKHIVYKTGSSVIVESGKSMKGGLAEDGGTKGNLGRSKTYSMAHLTELSTWERPEQIDDGLMPAIPISPRTFMAKESTAKGRHNWWHREWEVASRGLGRAINIFIPWYAERSKYWLPCPATWVPLPDTLSFARRVQEHGPRYMRRSVVLVKEQLYWYERKKLEAIEKNELYKFLEEYPAEPEEAFQYSGRSIFPIVVIDRVERQQRTLIDLLTVRPHLELIADQEALQAELLQEQRQMRQAAQKQADRAQDLVTNDPSPRPVQVETPNLLEGDPV